MTTYAECNEDGGRAATADRDDDDEYGCCAPPAAHGWDCEVDILSMDVGMNCKDLVVEVGVGRIERVGESSINPSLLDKSDRPLQEDARRHGNNDIVYPSDAHDYVSCTGVRAAALEDEEDGVLDFLTDEGDYTESVGTILPASDISLARFWDANQMRLYGSSHADNGLEGQAQAAQKPAPNGGSPSAELPVIGVQHMQHLAELFGGVDDQKSTETSDVDSNDDDHTDEHTAEHADEHADEPTSLAMSSPAMKKTWAQLLEDDLAQEGDYQSGGDEYDDDDGPRESAAQTTEWQGVEQTISYGLTSWHEDGMLAAAGRLSDHAVEKPWMHSDFAENVASTTANSSLDDSWCITKENESTNGDSYGYTSGGQSRPEGQADHHSAAAEEGRGSDCYAVKRTGSISTDGFSTISGGGPASKREQSSNSMAQNDTNATAGIVSETPPEQLALDTRGEGAVATRNDAAQRMQFLREPLGAALHSQSAADHSTAIDSSRQATAALASWPRWQGDLLATSPSAADPSGSTASASSGHQTPLPLIQDAGTGMPTSWLLHSGPWQSSSFSAAGQPNGHTERSRASTAPGLDTLAANGNSVEAAVSAAGEQMSSCTSPEVDDASLSSSWEGLPRHSRKRSGTHLTSSFTSGNGGGTGSNKEELPLSDMHSAQASSSWLRPRDADSLSVKFQRNLALFERVADESKARVEPPSGDVTNEKADKRLSTGVAQPSSSAAPQRRLPDDGSVHVIETVDVDVRSDSWHAPTSVAPPVAQQRQQQQQQPVNLANRTQPTMPSHRWPIDIRHYVGSGAKNVQSGTRSFVAPTATCNADRSFAAAAAADLVTALASPVAIRAAVTQHVPGSAAAGSATPVGTVRLCEGEPTSRLRTTARMPSEPVSAAAASRAVDAGAERPRDGANGGGTSQTMTQRAAGEPDAWLRHRELAKGDSPAWQPMLPPSAPSEQSVRDDRLQWTLGEQQACHESSGPTAATAASHSRPVASSDGLSQMHGSDYGEARKGTARHFLSAVLGRRMSNDPTVGADPLSGDRPAAPPNVGSAGGQPAVYRTAAEISGSRFVRPQMAAAQQQQQRPLAGNREADPEAAAAAAARVENGGGGDHEEQEHAGRRSATVGSDGSRRRAMAATVTGKPLGAAAAVEPSALATVAWRPPVQSLGVSMGSSSSSSGSGGGSSTGRTRCCLAEAASDAAATAASRVAADGWPRQPATECRPPRTWQSSGSHRQPPATATTTTRLPASAWPEQQPELWRVGAAAAGDEAPPLPPRSAAPPGCRSPASDWRDPRQQVAATHWPQPADLGIDFGLNSDGGGSSERCEGLLASAELGKQQQQRSCRGATAVSWDAGIRELEDMYERACWELQIGQPSANEKAWAIQP